jgi:hypothetical protein
LPAPPVADVPPLPALPADPDPVEEQAHARTIRAMSHPPFARRHLVVMSRIIVGEQVDEPHDVFVPPGK